MGKKSLSAEDICRIIRECKESGISEFVYHDLNLKFHPRRNEDAFAPGQVKDHETVVSEFSPKDKETAELMNDQALKDAEESQLLMDDAYGYERSQISKSLERQRVISEKA